MDAVRAFSMIMNTTTKDELCAQAQAKNYRGDGTKTAKEEFQQQKYTVLRQFISQEMVSFLFQYGQMRRRTAMTMIKTGHTGYRPNIDGTFMNKRVPGTYAVYSDPAMETLLEVTLPRLNDVLDMSLVPTYTYWRMYKTGDVLIKHKDRASCEVSATICVGYDNGDKQSYCWPIYMDSSQGVSGSKSACELNPGDLLVYRGCEVEHWREAFEGEIHMQVFMHLNDATSPIAPLNKYDCRPHLGLPKDFRGSIK